MPSFEEVKRTGYSRHRQASAGAGVTLVCGCGEYTALFECATRISKALGARDMEDLGDGLMESIPRFHIRFCDMAAALAKMTEEVSVALVDMEESGVFVLIWKIPKRESEPMAAENELELDDI